MCCVRIRFLHTESFRLAAIYAIAFALSVLAMGVVVLFLTGQALRDQILQSSRNDIAAVQRGYASAGVHEAREVVEQLMGAPAASDFYLLQQADRRVAGNLPHMAPQRGTVFLGAPGQRDILGVGEWIGPGLYVFSGSSMARVYSTQSHILNVLLWLFGAALLLAVLGGALVSRSFLARTDSMARACRAIMDGNLKARIPLRGTRDELDRLAATINEMLDRIAGLMENLGQVTNDIAHDLRTPVSQLRQRLERARTESATPGDYVAALDTAIQKSDEILALFAALLRIAQIEGGARRAAFAPVALAPLLRQMRELFEPVAEAADHRLRLAGIEDATIRGDQALLVQLFSNLIENAILHTPAGTEIVLALAQRDGQAIVTVSDDGPGVPRDEHAKLFQRLYRREASRSQPGYGLGLAMVAAIAELHGASVTVDATRVPGLSVVIAFAPAG
jgi:signal transduction histidine kinase